MASVKVLSQKHVMMAVLKEELKAIRERDGELNFRGTRTEEYLDACAQGSAKDAEKVFKKITELEIPRLKEEYVVKIVDIMPKTLDELKVVLSAYTITVSADNLKKILDAVNE